MKQGSSKHIVTKHSNPIDIMRSFNSHLKLGRYSEITKSSSHKGLNTVRSSVAAKNSSLNKRNSSSFLSESRQALSNKKIDAFTKSYKGRDFSLIYIAIRNSENFRKSAKR